MPKKKPDKKECKDVDIVPCSRLRCACQSQSWEMLAVVEVEVSCDSCGVHSCGVFMYCAGCTNTVCFGCAQAHLTDLFVFTTREAMRRRRLKMLDNASERLTHKPEEGVN